jgi:catechol 2,3-dioxygenase
MMLALRDPLGHAGRMVPAAVRECANILGLSHVELRVGDLDRSRAFYVDLLGFTESERDRERLYLRCVEDRQHHSLVLRQAPQAGLGHIAYKVADDESLDALARRFQHLGLPTRWLAAGDERATGATLRMQDPLGFPIEYHAAMEETPWLLQEYHRHRGAAPVRVDHVNVLVPDARTAHEWYTEELGFRCSEYTESDPPESRLWASWLFRKPTVHDVAIMTGPDPPPTTWA